MSESQEKKARELTESDNVYLDLYKNDLDMTEEKLLAELQETDEYGSASQEEQEKAAERIYDKLKVVQSNYLKWFEFLMAFVCMIMGYYANVWLLIFLKKMRQMEMENEVMQFQTIILMLMKIERVNVEMILEWLERYSNIFKEPISKCVNNFESGAWEALEELKEDIAFEQLIRIVESLQAAVEKIPIREAFDELDTERAYHQEKRKESNERLIARKSLIGKVVGYLIVPLCVIGMLSMSDAFSQMSSMSM